MYQVCLCTIDNKISKQKKIEFFKGKLFENLKSELKFDISSLSLMAPELKWLKVQDISS
jgi:hypothetical protein